MFVFLLVCFLVWLGVFFGFLCFVFVFCFGEKLSLYFVYFVIPNENVPWEHRVVSPGQQQLERGAPLRLPSVLYKQQDSDRRDQVYHHVTRSDKRVSKSLEGHGKVTGRSRDNWKKPHLGGTSSIDWF